MISRSGTYLLVTALFAGLAAPCVPIHMAHAQDADEAEAESEAAEAAKKAEARRAAKAAAPPAALPGAESREEEHGHASADMNPTDALFDAINRGSLGAAKEALNRGADMTGHNVLGQTPLDMAIDLNRNDITFLLLSMRTFSDSDPHFSSTSLAEGADDTPPLTMPRHATTASSIDRRYDASGGHAEPSVGFLGFGGS
ncbi:ankyrin repeat domain-containing protein [Komagataeibacter sp. FNDCF1]|uniref:ankyrin repeat domain-containing protein n=1 Tax=Komagataeibacter sp. FNDCF1 TaxID=2878681 RepID=UPI001E3BAE98|nr:ankyrin repeat domain-containing protein [Komagataeibacter sp. FNDCF1]MCE2564367.1 ankyrin repeat domain-containing protein [Komagataeibacter sp. FNDCF1]